MTFYKMLKILTATKNGTQMTRIRQGENADKNGFFLLSSLKNPFLSASLL
jgi:hypothetical protein